MPRLGRRALKEKLCELAGIRPDGRTPGYLSRREMLELIALVESSSSESRQSTLQEGIKRVHNARRTNKASKS